MQSDTKAAPSGAADAYARAYPICQETGLNSYALMKAASLGFVRTRKTPTGGMLFNVDDARRVSERGAGA